MMSIQNCKVSFELFNQINIKDTRRQHERIYKKNPTPRCRDTNFFNTKFGMTTSSFAKEYMKGLSYGSVLGIDPIFEGEYKISSTNMKWPIKGCVWVRYKTFTSKNCYWSLYHKNKKKLLFHWLIVSFNIPKTSTTTQMAPREGF